MSVLCVNEEGFPFSLKAVASASWFSGITAQLIFELACEIKGKISKYIIQRKIFDSLF